MPKWTRAQATENLLDLLYDHDIQYAICEGLATEYGLDDKPITTLCEWLESHDQEETANEYRQIWKRTKEVS
jgi:hypothetical protein